jgi:hypothetical protein
LSLILYLKKIGAVLQAFQRPKLRARGVHNTNQALRTLRPFARRRARRARPERSAIRARKP